jgi:hypothetical protein
MTEEIQSKIKETFNEKEKVVTIELPGKAKLTISADAEGLALTDRHANEI